MGLLDWLSDAFGSSSSPTQPTQPMPAVQPMDSSAAAAQPSPMMPPVQPTDMTTGPGTGGQPQQQPPAPPPGAGPPAQPPVPLPQPRPAGADAALPPNAMPTAGTGGPPPPPGAPPPAAIPSTASPPIAPAGPTPSPALTPIGRAFNLSPSEDGRVSASLAEGLKSVGQNWNKPGLAAFAASAGAGLEGGQKKAETQQKQATDYLKAAIDAKKAGDDAGYKQNYLQYLAAKLKSDTDKAASKDAANKNDTPTQLYLSAQRLVQNDPEVVDASKALQEAQKNGTPDEAAKAQANLQSVIQQKQAQHFAGLGLNPQTAAQLAKQPGNSQQNPLDGKQAGLTADNIGKKLQPGQFYTNPSDGKVYQYKGPPKSSDKSSSSIPSKPTNPEPANPTNTSAMSNGSTGGNSKSSDDDDED